MVAKNILRTYEGDLRLRSKQNKNHFKFEAAVDIKQCLKTGQIALFIAALVHLLLNCCVSKE